MAINIKFTKFDNTPWGFRLAGGSDFPQPLTVIKVLDGSLAECMGMKVGDVVVRLNDQPIGSLTHGQAHEELMRAGNNFVLGVQRGEDYLKAVEGLSEENIVPYKIPLADLPPLFPEQILKEETVIERYEETSYEEKTAEEVEAEPEVEPLPDKPIDANSEIVPNQNLTDDEIAQLILEEEELLNDQGVLGVNFKKLRPRLPVLKQSKVIEELQNIATAEPPLVEQLRRTSVFLQKPQRPVPVPRKKQEEEEEVTEVETYKVVIKKQQKRSITDRLLERGLLRPEGENTPEPPTPEVNMDSDEMGTKIEEDDASSSSSSSFASSEALDDGPCPQQPIATCSMVFSPCLEAISSLSIEPAPFERDDNTDVAQIQLSRRKENVASARRSPSKRRVKRFYTRAHYFRRCLFGKRGDAKKPAKVRPSVREQVQDDDSRDYGESSAPLGEGQQGSRRGSLEKACGSKMKGRYLETYFKREDNWIRRVVDGLLEKQDGFSPNKSFDSMLSSKEASSWRTRYAEKILARSVQFVAVRFRSDLFKHLELARSKDTGSPAESYPLTRKRMYFKGRYFQRLLSSNLVRLMDCIKGASSSAAEVPRGGRRRSSAIIKMKGRYMEKCLLGSSFPDFPDRFSARPSAQPSKRRRLFARTRYGERFFKTHLEYLGLIMKYVRCQVLQGISDTSVVIPNCYSLNSSQNGAAVEEDEGVLGNLIRSSKDLIATEVFHRGSRRLSRSCRGSVSAPSPSSSVIGNILSNFGLDFNWLPSKLVGGSSAGGAIGEKKAVLDADRDGRRLSFVPTILYEGLTNRIGVDFTRLVAYAFVPCTSIILLYMYK